MTTITLTEFRQHLDKYLNQAQVEEIAIDLDNGQLVRLSAVDQEMLDDEVIESDLRFAQIIAERRVRYEQEGGVSFSVVKQTLVDELIQDLSHPDLQARYEAAQNLVRLGEAVIQPLIDYCLDYLNLQSVKVWQASLDLPFIQRRNLYGQALAAEVLMAISQPVISALKAIDQYRSQPSNELDKPS